MQQQRPEVGRCHVSVIDASVSASGLKRLENGLQTSAMKHMSGTEEA